MHAVANVISNLASEFAMHAIKLANNSYAYCCTKVLRIATAPLLNKQTQPINAYFALKSSINPVE